MSVYSDLFLGKVRGKCPSQLLDILYLLYLVGLYSYFIIGCKYAYGESLISAKFLLN